MEVFFGGNVTITGDVESVILSLTNLVEKLPFVQRLHICSPEINDRVLQLVEQTLALSRAPVELILQLSLAEGSDNDSGPRGPISTGSNFFMKASALRKLSLLNITVSEQVFRMLGEALEQEVFSLDNLIFRECSVNDADVGHILAPLSNGNIRGLHFFSPSGPEGNLAGLLATALASSQCALESWTLARTFKAFDIPIFLRALMAQTTRTPLLSLDILGSFDPDATRLLAELIALPGCRLTHVGIDNCVAGNEEIEELGLALARNSSVETLNIRNTYIAMCHNIVNSLSSPGNNITSLDIRNNYIGGAAIGALTRVLASNSGKLSTLFAGENTWDDADMLNFSTCLKTNTTLTFLDVSWLDIESSGAQSFVRV